MKSTRLVPPWFRVMMARMHKKVEANAVKARKPARRKANKAARIARRVNR